jgi:hypothetical protein
LEDFRFEFPRQYGASARIGSSQFLIAEFAATGAMHPFAGSHLPTVTLNNQPLQQQQHTQQSTFTTTTTTTRPAALT